MLKRGDEVVEEEQENDQQKRDGAEEGEGEGQVLGPRLYREFWSSRGKKNAGGNFFAVRG